MLLNCRKLSAIAMAIAVLLSGRARGLADAPSNPWAEGASPALTSLAAAAEEERYAFVIFWKENDEATQQMITVVTAAAKELGADGISIGIADPSEAETVKIFGVDRAPMPLVAAVAPNGAVTKAWPLKVRSDQLAEGIVSRGTAACLKAMQDQKLILLSIHNAKTTHNRTAIAAVEGFKADERFAVATEIVTLDPSDPKESMFLRTIEVSPRTTDAVTLVMSPKGQAIARFTGAVTTEQLIEKVTSAQAGCCPDGKCGPGGCCPGGNCAPDKK